MRHASYLPCARAGTGVKSINQQRIAHPVFIPSLLLELQVCCCGQAPGLIAAVDYMTPLIGVGCMQKLEFDIKLPIQDSHNALSRH